MTWADGYMLAAVVAMVVNVVTMFRACMMVRRLKRINAALFITLTMAWSMRGWIIDLDDDGPRYTRRTSWLGAVPTRKGNGR